MDRADQLRSGALLIAAERQRQIEQEGWTPVHDDMHVNGELISAARAYALHALEQSAVGGDRDCTCTPLEWPFEFDWWKPSSDPVRNLVKAGAFIAAEIDRLERAGKIHEQP